jgi:hypothetical protein
MKDGDAVFERINSSEHGGDLFEVVDYEIEGASEADSVSVAVMEGGRLLGVEMMLYMGAAVQEEAGLVGGIEVTERG